jgi:hypothetical protein
VLGLVFQTRVMAVSLELMGGFQLIPLALPEHKTRGNHSNSLSCKDVPRTQVGIMETSWVLFSYEKRIFSKIRLPKSCEDKSVR